MTPPDPANERLMDPDGRIAADLPCIHCGYNLRTLAHDANCPECGHAVRDTLNGDFLCFAPARYVRRLAAGFGLLLFVGIQLLSFPLIYLLPRGVPLRVAAVTAPIVVIMTLLTAVWLMTIRDPRHRGRPDGFSSRRALRMSIVPAVLAMTLLVIAGRLPSLVASAVGQGIGAGTLIFVSLIFLRYCETLARRLANRPLAENVPLLAALFLIAGLALVIASIGATFCNWPSRLNSLIVIPAGVGAISLLMASFGLMLFVASLALQLARTASHARDFERQRRDFARPPTPPADSVEPAAHCSSSPWRRDVGCVLRRTNVTRRADCASEDASCDSAATGRVPCRRVAVVTRRLLRRHACF